MWTSQEPFCKETNPLQAVVNICIYDNHEKDFQDFIVANCCWWFVAFWTRQLPKIVLATPQR